jgi:hypothetical protein
VEAVKAAIKSLPRPYLMKRWLALSCYANAPPVGSKPRIDAWRSHRSAVYDDLQFEAALHAASTAHPTL